MHHDDTNILLVFKEFIFVMVYFRTFSNFSQTGHAGIADQPQELTTEDDGTSGDVVDNTTEERYASIIQNDVLVSAIIF